MSGIYKGYNPIFESMKQQLFEEESKIDVDSLIRTIYDTFVSLIVSGSDEAVKTPDGFKAYMSKALQSSSLDSIKLEFEKRIDLMAATDKNQAGALAQSKSYIGQLFATLKSAVGEDAKGLQKVTDKMTALMGATIASFQSVEVELQKNESLVTRYLMEDSEKLTGEEADSEDGLADKWYTQLSKNLLDSATSFKGETASAMASKNLAGNSEVQGYSQASQQYLEQAKDLAISGGRRGLFQTGKLQTASGPMKAKDYRVKAQNLVNEIIRQREEFRKLNYKLSNIPAPTTTTVICPTGMTFDAGKNACVYVNVPVVNTGGNGGGSNQEPRPPKPSPNPAPVTTGCSFPVSIGASKCSEVALLQGKLISMGSCIADILNKAGGADGRYGKVTSKLANITYAYLTKSQGFDPKGPLTQDMYNVIMAGGQLTFQTADTSVKKESLNIEADSKVLENRIFEREHKAGTSVLSFEDFSKVVTEALYLNEDAGPAPSGSTDLASCICLTYQSGTINANCFAVVPVPNPTGGTGATGGTGGVEPPTREDWKGLKYVDTGSYPVSFDESLLSAWSKEIVLTAVSFAIPGSGYLLKAGSAGVRSLGSRAAARVGAKKLAAKIAGKAAVTRAAATIGARKTASSQLAGLTRMFWVKYKKIPIPKRVAGGIIGGTVGAGVLDFISGRNSYMITVTEGYIERTNLLGIVGGMVDTIDGYVSDDDWATITTTLAVIKGAWTVGEDDQPISAWGEFKRLYKEAEGEDFMDDLKSVRAKMGDVEGYPKIKSLSPLSSVQDLDWDIAADETKKFAEYLDKNESSLAQNLNTLPADYVRGFIEGSYVEYDEEGNIEGLEDSEEAGTEKEAKAETKKGL
jgi:hypothetical protein